MLARAALIAWLILLSTPVLADIPTNPRRQELMNLVRQDCGACHGLTLKGGLGPPLTPAALRGKPTEYLRTVILDGRAGTPMPPWRPFISESEAVWLVDVLKQGAVNDR
jgi:cytochrome c55X